jgi:hypothetical protein
MWSSKAVPCVATQGKRLFPSSQLVLQINVVVFLAVFFEEFEKYFVRYEEILRMYE